MKRLIKAIARRFGVDIQRPRDGGVRIQRLPYRGLTEFINATESDLEFELSEISNRAQFTRETIHNPVLCSDATQTVIVEGWRFFAHSYAMVNQWQLLALLRRPDIGLRVRDMPLHSGRLQTAQGIFDERAECLLRSIETAPTDESADLTLRIQFPFDFSLSLSRRTAVFGTSEAQTILKGQLADTVASRLVGEGRPPADVTVVTPSNWSAEGFYKSGFKTEQVRVIPHGVDSDIFHPMPHLRREMRNKLAIPDESFVFLSFGSAVGNKGMGFMLRAFAEVCRKFPHARLMLKGMDQLYNSKYGLLQTLERLPRPDQKRVLDRMVYFGGLFSNTKIAALYQAADAYVSPYRGEGFNMPVLEAAACGIPVICTAGGATDDFVTDAFARKIESRKISIKVEDQEASRLQPNLEHLIVLMSMAIEDRAWRELAAQAGPQHVQGHYTWDHVVGKLVGSLLDSK